MISYLAPEILYPILPLIAVTGGLLLSLFVFSILNAVRGQIRFARAEGYDTFFLNSFFINWWMWLFQPIARFMVRFNVHPNVITWLQIPVALVASMLFAMGSFGPAGWIVCFGATLDFVDGFVAKQANLSTKAGGFLDSTLDRYVDFFILMGYVAYYRHSSLWVIPMLAILGSAAVPYIRAKGESLGIANKVGGMQRAERIFFLGFPAAVAPVLSAFIEQGAARPVYHLALFGVAIVAIFANVTATMRGHHVFKTLAEQEQQE